MYLGCSLPQINATGGFISQALAEWQEAFAAVCNQDEVLSANDNPPQEENGCKLLMRKDEKFSCK